MYIDMFGSVASTWSRAAGDKWMIIQGMADLDKALSPELMCTTFHDPKGTAWVRELEAKKTALGQAVSSLEVRIFASHKRNDVNPLTQLRDIVLLFASGTLFGQPLRRAQWRAPNTTEEEDEVTTSPSTWRRKLCTFFPRAPWSAPLPRFPQRVLLWNDMVSIRRDNPSERTRDADAIPDVLQGPSSVIVMCLSPRYLQSVWCIMELVVISKLLLDSGHRMHKYFFTCLCSTSDLDGHNPDEESARSVRVTTLSPRERDCLDSPLQLFTNFSEWPSLDTLRDKGHLDTHQHAWLSTFFTDDFTPSDNIKIIKTTLLYGLGTLLQHNLGPSNLAHIINEAYFHVHNEVLFDGSDERDYQTVHMKCLERLNILMHPFRTGGGDGSIEDEGPARPPWTLTLPQLFSAPRS